MTDDPHLIQELLAALIEARDSTFAGQCGFRMGDRHQGSIGQIARSGGV